MRENSAKDIRYWKEVRRNKPTWITRTNCWHMLWERERERERETVCVSLNVRFVHSPCAEAGWNVMAHAQKPDFFFRRNGRVHLNRPRGISSVDYCAAEVCASAVVMLDTPCSEVVWRVLATHCIRQFPLHFPTVRHRVPSRFSWTLPSYKTSFQSISRFLWNAKVLYCLQNSLPPNPIVH